MGRIKESNQTNKQWTNADPVYVSAVCAATKTTKNHDILVCVVCSVKYNIGADRNTLVYMEAMHLRC